MKSNYWYAGIGGVSTALFVMTLIAQTSGVGAAETASNVPAAGGATMTAFLDCPLRPSCPVAPASGEKSISLQLAFEGASAALEACADIHFGGGSVAVLDQYGVPIVAIRQPGGRGVDIEVARRKAYTALRAGVSSADFGKSVNYRAGAAQPAVAGTPAPKPTGPDLNFDPLNLPVWNNDPHLVPFGGGLLIKAGDRIVGAIGVTGVPPRDGPCAKAGQSYIEEKLR